MRGKERLVDLVYRKVVLPMTGPNPEGAHDALFTALSLLERSDLFLKVLRREFAMPETRPVSVEALGLELPTPFIVAGGLIKDGRGASAIAAMGPSGIDAGTFTSEELAGNSKIRQEVLYNGRRITLKRVERFPDGTIINWQALNNPGIERGMTNLEPAMRREAVPIGINIAPRPGLPYDLGISDLGGVIERVWRGQFRPAWITLNLSCPNTTETPRNQERHIDDVLKTLHDFSWLAFKLERETDIFIPKVLKIGPDMSPGQIREIVRAVKRFGFQGIVATNTTIDRTGPREKYAHIAKGGLSGHRLFERSRQAVEFVRRFDKELGGTPLVVIACGGIDSYQRWLQMKEVGADLAEMLTPFIFGGPYFFKQMNREYSENPEV